MAELSKLRPLVAWLALSFLFFFLFRNFVSLTNLGGYSFLAAFFLLSVFLFFNWSGMRVDLEQGFLFFILFIVYFGLMMALEGSHSSRIVAELFGSTSGLFFFLILGVLSQLSVAALASNIQVHGTAFFWASLSLLMLVLWTSSFALYSHYQDVRPNVFLVKNDYGAYQRPANLIFIQHLICCSIVLSAIAAGRSLGFCRVATLFVMLVIISFIELLLCQLIGSNKGAFAIAFSGGVTGLAVLYKLEPRKQLRKAVQGKRLMALMIEVFALLSFVGLMIFIFRIFNIMEGLYQLRAFSFGNNEFSSIFSRLELLQNFRLHLSVNPVFGHTQVEELTTGSGSYVHSLVSLVTHCGVVGTSIFVLASTLMFFRYRQRWSGFASSSIDFWTTTCSKYYFASLLFLCLLSSVFTWAPLWFGIGFFASVFQFSVNKSSTKASI